MSSCFDGCGTVFKLTPQSDGSWKESILYSFCSENGCSDGETPSFGALIFDSAGNLYGTTASGGNQCEFGGCGVVFQLTQHADGSWRESALYAFCSLSHCEDGAVPRGSVIFDRAGNLYGTAELGGSGANSGVVFKLTPNPDGSWKEKVLHKFNAGDGLHPQAGLIFDQPGNLYGTTTFGGGPVVVGVVFRLAPNSNGGWRETMLHVFRNHGPGAVPSASLTFDPAGNLYGTTSGSANNNTFGSVFEITP